MKMELYFKNYAETSPCDNGEDGLYQEYLVELFGGMYEVASFTLDGGFCWSDDSLDHDVIRWAGIPKCES